MVSQKRAVGAQRCEMRPAGAGRPSSQKSIVDISEVRGNAAARPLSVGAVEFSPALGSRTRGTAWVRFSAVAEVHSLVINDDDDMILRLFMPANNRAMLVWIPGRILGLWMVPWRGYLFRNR